MPREKKMLIQPTGKDISSDSSESACCGGTYGSGGSGGFGISITVPSGKLFSSSEVYLETNNEKHKNICQLNNDCNSSQPLKKRAKTTSGMCTTNICYKLMYMYIQCTILFQVLNFLRNIGKNDVGNTET